MPKACQQQRAVGRYHQDGLLGNSVDVPQLCLSHTEGVLLVAVVDLDLPAVEINLQQLFGGALEIGGQQIGGLTVVETTAFAFTLRGGSHDQPP